MGNPDTYYKKALQAFAYSLAFPKKKALAKELYHENSVQKLQDFIEKKKMELPEKQFYYDAGKTCQYILKDTDENDGCDGFNACIGGLIEFEHFIGLHEENKKICE